MTDPKTTDTPPLSPLDIAHLRLAAINVAAAHPAPDYRLPSDVVKAARKYAKFIIEGK